MQNQSPRYGEFLPRMWTKTKKPSQSAEFCGSSRQTVASPVTGPSSQTWCTVSCLCAECLFSEVVPKKSNLKCVNSFLLLVRSNHIQLLASTRIFFWWQFLGNAVPDNEENAKLCSCPDCPTYQKSKLSNTVFCARGKAKETAKAAACLCPNCSVFKNYVLDQMYYCIIGKSIDIKS